LVPQHFGGGVRFKTGVKISGANAFSGFSLVMEWRELFQPSLQDGIGFRGFLATRGTAARAARAKKTERGEISAGKWRAVGLGR
jgi:hypothetical protein